jgi:hypothetical protein
MALSTFGGQPVGVEKPIDDIRLSAPCLVPFAPCFFVFCLVPVGLLQCAAYLDIADSPPPLP